MSAESHSGVPLLLVVIIVLMGTAGFGGVAFVYMGEKASRARSEAQLAQLKQMQELSSITRSLEGGQLLRTPLADDWPPEEVRQLQFLWSLGAHLGLNTELSEEGRRLTLLGLLSPHTSVRVLALTLLHETQAAAHNDEMMGQVVSQLRSPVCAEIASSVLKQQGTPAVINALISSLQGEWSPDEQWIVANTLEILDLHREHFEESHGVQLREIAGTEGIAGGLTQSFLER